jgi:hypothetical protein
MKKLIFLLLLFPSICLADSAGYSVSGDRIILGNTSSVYGFGAYTSDHQVYILLRADANILIDGRTNPRIYTLGSMRFDQTPDVPSTRAINIDVDMNSQPDTHAVNVNYRATGMVTGDYSHIYDGHVDRANSTGGDLSFYTCGVTGEGTVDVNCLDIYADTGVIEHHSGVLANMDNGWVYDGAFNNATSFFNNATSNVEVFTDNLDYIYVCDAATFNDIAVSLITPASGAGVKPVAQYTAGAASWTTFAIADGTNGFRQSGNMRFILDDIPLWTTDTVNGVANQYCVRIQRTQNTVAVSPIESTIKIISSVDYRWDKDGNVNIATLKSGTPTNYSEFEADGTYLAVGDATVWKDVNTTSSALSIGATAPSRITIASTTIRTYAFTGIGAIADELHGSVETPHDYKEGTSIIVHPHWAPTTADAGNVKWQLEYFWISDTGTVSTSTTISVTSAAGGVAWAGKLNDFPTISGVGRIVGDRFGYRIFRDPADAADTYAFDVALYDVGIHYEADTLGSRDTLTK